VATLVQLSFNKYHLQFSAFFSAPTVIDELP